MAYRAEIHIRPKGRIDLHGITTATIQCARHYALTWIKRQIRKGKLRKEKIMGVAIYEGGGR